jgi:hypothetical protein
MPGKHRQAELRTLAGAREVRYAEKLQIVAPDAEHRVACEIDALDIRAYRRIVLRGTEAQPAIVGIESEKMPLEGGSIGWRELGCEDHRAWI